MPQRERYKRRFCTLQYNAHLVNPDSIPFKIDGQFNTPGVFKAMSFVLKNQAKKVLWKRFKQLFPYPIDSKGYLTEPAHNLLPGIKLEHFISELSSGSGNELAGKFRAVHSSSALAVNTFSPFKDNPAELDLIGIHGFSSIRFEQKLPTGLGGTPPNIDLIAENETDVVVIESKFLEYFGLKSPHFKSSYTKKAFPKAEEKWLDLMERLRDSAPKHLDVAQLIKHYLGLRNTIDCSKRQVTLLYLFWEPQNRKDFVVFQTHRNELDEFSREVDATSIRFAYKSYPELWAEWEEKGIYKEHLRNLHKRYDIVI